MISGVGKSDASARRRRRRPAEDPLPTPHTSPLSPSTGEEPPGTADVVLIAHPENLLLGTRYPLARGEELEIGREPTCHISLPDVTSVSRRHARLTFGEQIRIEDLGSTNGTLVEDQIVTGSREIRSGERFQVGAVHFKLLHERDVEHAYHVAVYELMMRDGLTGLYNRRKFEEEAQRECIRADRYHRPLSLVLFDADDFKSVNDTHGHLKGDAVLKKIAAAAQDLTRSEQVVARVGGEEFGVLCPEVGSDGAEALAERLREAIGKIEHRHQERSFAVTCSFGVAAWDASRQSFSELYDAADAALYESKQGGRNRTTVAHPGR